MPLPFILGAAAAVAGVVGVGSGISGAVKMKEANDTMGGGKWRHEQNIEKLEKRNKSASESMDRLGTLELNILRSFEDFCNTIEKIQNRPRFEGYRQEGVKLPEYDAQKLTEVSVGAGVLLGGLGGAALGTAGGFAAAGAENDVRNGKAAPIGEIYNDSRDILREGWGFERLPTK